MNTFVSLLTILVVALLFILPDTLRRHENLRLYWERQCMGIRWRRRFAEVPKAEIREFLTLFVDAFGYDHQRRTCFSPDDRVMDIYRAENPPGSIVDQMELESFALSIDERYGLDLEAIWKDDLTLGELFAHTRKRGA